MKKLGMPANDNNPLNCTSSKWRLLPLLAAAGTASIFIGIASLFVFHGKANADEGFYALISHEVMHGKLLYKDLAYTQTPLLPYIQGAVMSIVGFGYAQQRWLNVSFQAISLALAVNYLIRRGLSIPLTVGLSIVWCLCLPILYYGTIGKTYALAQLFLIIASLCIMRTTRPIPALILLSLCGVLAVGCRLTVAPAVAVLWIGFCRIHAAIVPRALLVLTPLLFAVLLIGPFIAVAPANAYFWMWDFHKQSAIPRAHITTLAQLPLFAPGVSIVAVIGLISCLFHYSRDYTRGLCVLGAGIIGAIVSTGASGVYLDYAVPCLGLIVLGVGEILALRPLPHCLHYPSAVLCALISIVAFFLQDRNWDGENYPAEIAAAGRYIAAHSAPEDLLLTSMPELGLAANRSPFPRSEMGKFATTEEMDPQKAFDRRIIQFGELVFMTERAIPKIIGLSRAERWNFRWSIPSNCDYPKEDYNDFVSALEKEYSCTFYNERFLIYTRKR